MVFYFHAACFYWSILLNSHLSGHHRILHWTISSDLYLDAVFHPRNTQTRHCAPRLLGDSRKCHRARPKSCRYVHTHATPNLFATVQFLPLGWGSSSSFPKVRDIEDRSSEVDVESLRRRKELIRQEIEGWNGCKSGEYQGRGILLHLRI